MPTSFARQIRNANAAVELILNELCTHAFAYTVEQKEGRWTLRVECATDAGWQVTTLPVSPAELTASLRDPAVHDRLRAAWRPHLRECAGRGDPKAAGS